MDKLRHNVSSVEDSVLRDCHSMEPTQRKIHQVPKSNTVNERKGPPKAPRTAFMCFSDSRFQLFSSQDINKKDCIQRVAEEWRSLTSKERAEWDEVAREDKLRYEREKSCYTGPWNLPKRRAKKHPLAPKRPMSAFLKYSQSRRALVKLQNPDMSNTDVSRLLGEMWRLASEREKRPYVEEEERERASYKQDTAAFRAQMARVDAASRTRHGDYNDEEKDVVWDPPATEIWNVREYTTESSGPRSNFQDLRRLDSLYHGHENLSYQPHPISYPHSFPQAPSFDSFTDSIPQGSFGLDHDFFLEESSEVSDEHCFLTKSNRYR